MILRKDMSSTIELLRILGSPSSEPQVPILKPEEIESLAHSAYKNRMLLFFLEAVKKNGMKTPEDSYERENIRYLKTDNSVARASGILRDANIKHAVFKTIRPYKSATVDIDIIIFGDHARSIEIMKKAGYSLVEKGPSSTTMWDKEGEIGVDLYDEVGVSSITYINKRKMVDCVSDGRLPNEKWISILAPEADLACIVAHSIIKEQMYALSEFYTFVNYLERINVNKFVSLVKYNNIAYAAKVHSAITAFLYEVAFGEVPKKLRLITDALGKENFETGRLQKRSFRTPSKYHPLTVARSLVEISKEGQTRKSMLKQVVNSVNPDFSIQFVKKFTEHIFRETY
jgi:hypothetical protein